jgi:hypothetical protein
MIDKDAQGAAKRFMTKLVNKGFTLSCLKSDVFYHGKQGRTSKAVDEFTKTAVFRDILKLR